VTGRKSYDQDRVKTALNELPAAELDVLACLWQKSNATARELREAMQKYRPMTHGAIATLLRRLESKGLVSKSRGPVGKAFIYTSTRAPGPTYRRIMRETRQRIFGGSGVTMVASLLENGPPTEEELDELQRLLNDLRAKARKKGRES